MPKQESGGADISIAEVAETKLRRDAIGVWHIVFFAMAAAVPLAVVVEITPFTLAFGNCIGVPLPLLLAGLMCVVFSIDFTGMIAAPAFGKGQSHWVFR